jgi:hypothetical protein
LAKVISKSREAFYSTEFQSKGAVNDPLDFDDCESVKGFINRKVKAVISFYGLEEIE